MIISQIPATIKEDSVSIDDKSGHGQYDAKYFTQQALGKGAFGFVKLAQRKSDNLEVNIA